MHCGTDAIYMNALGAPDGGGPGGIFRLDHDTFEVLGPWEADRGQQQLAYDFWWHLGHDTVITSEWGTPNMVTEGLNPELLLGGQVRPPAARVRPEHPQAPPDASTWASEYQMVLELRPAHDPRKAYGFAGVVISLEDLSASIWTWYLEGGNGKKGGEWKAKKIIDIPAVPADPALLPPLLKGFGAVPPLVSDINLSLDDRYLYVSCWGTGDLLQYDVSDPFAPVFKGKVSIGGIVAHAAHPGSPEKPRNGGPQMVELSRDGRRVYFTNSLYSPVGRAVLSRGHQRVDGEGGRHPGGGHRARPGIPGGVRQGNAPAPGAAAGRRRVLRLVLLFVTDTSWYQGLPWLTLLLLGALHGLNPGMGWLFAVALGFQEREGRAVWRALPPLAAGHALAVGRGPAAAGGARASVSRRNGAGRARRAADRTRRVPAPLAPASAHGRDAGQRAAAHRAGPS